MKKEVSERIKKATVAIVAALPNAPPGKRPFTIVGSGFCVDAQGVIITCEHVFRAFINPDDYIRTLGGMANETAPKIHELRGAQPLALFFNGVVGHEVLFTPIPIATAAHKQGFDLMAAQLRPHPAFRYGFPTVEVADYNSLYEGQEIGTCGFPLGDGLHNQMGSVTSSFTKGTLSTISPAAGVEQSGLKGFQLDLTATHGNSGGPVYELETGKVFGVLKGGFYNSEGNLMPGLVRAEPIYPLLADDTIGRVKNPKIPA